MFEISVITEFSAAHAISIAGRTEPLHGHNWRVTAAIVADSLDADGLVCDFHAVERSLRDILGPFNNANLNETPPFDQVNPTAEQIALHIGERLSELLAGALPAGARVGSVEVTEAPGCAAIYRPERSS